LSRRIIGRVSGSHRRRHKPSRSSIPSRATACPHASCLFLSHTPFSTPTSINIDLETGAETTLHAPSESITDPYPALVSRFLGSVAAARSTQPINLGCTRPDTLIGRGIPPSKKKHQKKKKKKKKVVNRDCGCAPYSSVLGNPPGTTWHLCTLPPKLLVVSIFCLPVPQAQKPSPSDRVVVTSIHSTNFRPTTSKLLPIHSFFPVLS
jgi:hypothetical protein